MGKETVLALLLREKGHFVSGEAVSAELGITRAAIWKSISALRAQGYEIDAVTGRGYCLKSLPDTLTEQTVRSYLGPVETVGKRIDCFDSIDSTNAYLKRIALDGAPDGTVAVAAEQGLTFTFQNVQMRNAHPNTARLKLTGANGRALDIVAESVGGGRIRIRSIDGIETNFSGEHNTLIVHNQDTPGHVAAVTAALMQRHVNIATMQLYRDEQGGYAVMILECDQPIPKDIEQWLSHIEGIQKITIFNQEEPV